MFFGTICVVFALRFVVFSTLHPERYSIDFCQFEHIFEEIWWAFWSQVEIVFLGIFLRFQGFQFSICFWILSGFHPRAHFDSLRLVIWAENLRILFAIIPPSLTLIPPHPFPHLPITFRQPQPLGRPTKKRAGVKGRGRDHATRNKTDLRRLGVENTCTTQQ